MGEWGTGRGGDGVGRSGNSNCDDFDSFVNDDSLLDETNFHKPIAKTPRVNWLRKFDAFVARQSSRNPTFDDRRESLYPVR